MLRNKLVREGGVDCVVFKTQGRTWYCFLEQECCGRCDQVPVIIDKCNMTKIHNFQLNDWSEVAVEDWFCVKSATAELTWRHFEVSQSETWTASVSKDVRDVFPNWSRQGIEASNDDHEDNNVINKLVQNVVRIMRWPDVFGPDGLRAPNVGDLQVAFHPFWKYAGRLFSVYQSRGFMPKSNL